MKKLFITLLVLFSVSSFAQNHFVGAQLGMNLSNVYGTDYSKELEFLSSFSAGLTYDFELKNNILLGSGLLYERKGSQSELIIIDDEGYSLGEYSYKTRYSYLSLPLKTGYQIGQEWTGYFYLGLVPAYLLEAHNAAPTFYNNEVSEGDKKTDITDIVNVFELSGLLELGSAYRLNSKWAIFINSSYLMGFTPIYKDSDSPHPKNHRINISLGVKYALNGE